MNSKEKLIEILDRNFGYTEEEQAEIVAERLLDAGVRPVVTCGECEWWTKQEASCQGRCALLEMYPTGGWFCANGKRKETK